MQIVEYDLLSLKFHFKTIQKILVLFYYMIYEFSSFILKCV